MSPLLIQLITLTKANIVSISWNKNKEWVIQTLNQTLIIHISLYEINKQVSVMQHKATLMQLPLFKKNKMANFINGITEILMYESTKRRWL